MEAFHTLDPDGHGYLSKDVISTLMTQDGEPFTQEELDEMLEIAMDPYKQNIPYEYYINQLMVIIFVSYISNYILTNTLKKFFNERISVIFQCYIKINFV